MAKGTRRRIIGFGRRLVIRPVRSDAPTGVMMMVLAIGDRLCRVAQAVHSTSCRRRADNSRREQQGEHGQEGAQAFHGRLDIEYHWRTQAAEKKLPMDGRMNRTTA